MELLGWILPNDWIVRVKINSYHNNGGMLLLLPDIHPIPNILSKGVGVGKIMKEDGGPKECSPEVLLDPLLSLKTQVALEVQSAFHQLLPYN